MSEPTKPNVADIANSVLVARAIRSARYRGRGTMPRWAVVMEVFALGSGYAQQLCVAHGFDPDTPVNSNGASRKKKT